MIQLGQVAHNRPIALFLVRCSMFEMCEMSQLALIKSNSRGSVDRQVE